MRKTSKKNDDISEGVEVPGVFMCEKGVSGQIL